MSNQNTVSINGVHYDPISGLPVTNHDATEQQADTAAQLTRKVAHHAGGVHKTASKPQTLNRSFVKKPANGKQISDMMPAKTVTRSPHITKFAPEHAKPSAPAAQSMHKSPVHPSVQKAHAQSAERARAARRAPAAQPSAQQTKQHSISTALANAATSHHEVYKAPKQIRSGRRRLASVSSAAFAVLLLAGYFTYLNIPTLSVRLAASQAGIEASYPQYRPSGYNLNGPVAFQSGQVSMNFTATAGPQKFALVQTKSTWDSTALLTNYVEPDSNGEYATYNDSGLTIYTYGNNAAWMNDGILHTIKGSAPLSNDQIRSIATSM